MKWHIKMCHCDFAQPSRAPVSWHIGIYDAKKIGKYAKNLDPRRKDMPRFQSPASVYIEK